MPFPHEGYFEPPTPDQGGTWSRCLRCDRYVPAASMIGHIEYHGGRKQFVAELRERRDMLRSIHAERDERLGRLLKLLDQALKPLGGA